MLDVEFWDTSIPFDERNRLPHAGLVRTRIGVGEAEFDAPLNDRPPRAAMRWAPFAEWWSASVLDDRAGNRASRRDLVLALANKEGGAHVDKALSPAYRALTRERELGIPVILDGVRLERIGRIELLSMRQIAHEILETLARHFPES